MKQLPTYFVSHGGGPWPWLKKEMPYYDVLEKSLQAIPRFLVEKPKAILVISGHWEEDEFTVMTTPNPPMIYDYSGFPPQTYQIKYSAPGSPPFAARSVALIGANGIEVRTDDQRGFDHGTFSTVYPMYPHADVPVFQISLKSNYDPLEHFQLGRALAPLREEGILILGSGLSYHNLGAMRSDPEAGPVSKEFDQWLQQTLLYSDPVTRFKKLMRWADSPAARAAHPQEDHLLPLMVAAGAAENDSATLIYHEDEFMGNIATSSFRFGG